MQQESLMKEQTVRIERSVLRSVALLVNTAPLTHRCGRALFVIVRCNAGVFHTLIFALAVVVFGNALVCCSFTVAHHHVVLCNVVLLTEFAPSMDNHISFGIILDKMSSTRC